MNTFYRTINNENLKISVKIAGFVVQTVSMRAKLKPK